MVAQLGTKTTSEVGWPSLVQKTYFAGLYTPLAPDEDYIVETGQATGQRIHTFSFTKCLHVHHF